MKKLIFLILLIICSAFAIADTVKIGGYKITYDEVIEGDSDFDGINDRTSYYLNDNLVFSAFDTTGDGKQDMWFTYTNGTYKETAMRDTTGDSKPENILTYNMNGDIVDEEKKLNLPWIWIILAIVVIVGVVIYFKKKKKEKMPIKKDHIKKETPKKEKKLKIKPVKKDIPKKKSKIKPVLVKVKKGSIKLSGQVKEKTKKGVKYTKDKISKIDTEKIKKNTKNFSQKVGKKVKKTSARTKVKIKKITTKVKNKTKRIIKIIKEK